MWGHPESLSEIDFAERRINKLQDRDICNSLILRRKFYLRQAPDGVQLKVGVKAEPCRGSFLLAIDDGVDKSLKIK